MEKDKEIYLDEIFKEYGKIEGFKIIKNLDKGRPSRIKLISYNKKQQLAAKLIEKEKSEKFDEIEYIKDLAGPHIVHIKKICQMINKPEKNYCLIIMEKGELNDFSRFINYFHSKNLLKLIYPKWFDENVSDTILKYFARQIIDGMMTLYQNNYVHFGIKPENILVFNNLILKITDFSLLKKIDDNAIEIKIPGGTKGYTTREYLLDKRLNASEARKQDYFALGCTLFLLKYGFPLLKYSDKDNREKQTDEFIYLLDKKINYIQSYKKVDKDFITFIINLLKINPDERLKFEEIYRNKWLNKNIDEINKIIEDYYMNDLKFILNLQLHDFFKQKNIIFEFNHPSNASNKKNKRYTRKCFSFKKKENEDD